MRKARRFFGSGRGVPQHTRKIDFDYRDAVKCGMNTATLTEITTPAQDYRMVTLFQESTMRMFSLVAQKMGVAIPSANTSHAGDPNGVAALNANGSFVETDVPPFLMTYYLMNPSISPMEVWVEVWCVRRGYAPRDSMAEDYLKVGDDNSIGPVFNATRWNRDDGQTDLPPKIHSVALDSSMRADDWPRDEVKNANAVLPHVMQIFTGNDSWRRRAYKMLSRRRRIIIPPGGIHRFKVKINIPRQMIDKFAFDATYPLFLGGDRLVVIKWSTLMGTVTGALETTHLSEKVHLVVARKAKFVAYASLKHPNIHMQVVEQQGTVGTTTRDYNVTGVADHIQRMEVTKSAQQIESVP